MLTTKILTFQDAQLVHGLVRQKVTGLTMAGAVYLCAFPLDHIKAVLAAYYPSGTYPYLPKFRTMLENYTKSAGITVNWIPVYDLLKQLAIPKDAPREELPQMGSTGGDFKSVGNIFRAPDGTIHKLNPNKYRKPDYNKLHEEFEHRRLEGIEPATAANPFMVRRQGQALTDAEQYVTEQNRVHHMLENMKPNDIPELEQMADHVDKLIAEGKIANSPMIDNIFGTLNPFRTKLNAYKEYLNYKENIRTNQAAPEPEGLAYDKTITQVAQENSKKAIQFEEHRKNNPELKDYPNPYADTTKTVAQHSAEYMSNLNKLATRLNDPEINSINTQPTNFVAKKENLEAFNKLKEKHELDKLERLATAGNFMNQHKESKAAQFKALAQTASPLSTHDDAPPPTRRETNVSAHEEAIYSKADLKQLETQPKATPSTPPATVGLRWSDGQPITEY